VKERRGWVGRTVGPCNNCNMSLDGIDPVTTDTHTHTHTHPRRRLLPPFPVWTSGMSGISFNAIAAADVESGTWPGRPATAHCTALDSHSSCCSHYSKKSDCPELCSSIVYTLQVTENLKCLSQQPRTRTVTVAIYCSARKQWLVTKTFLL